MDSFTNVWRWRQGQEGNCAICLEEFCPGVSVRSLPCLHTFHAQCGHQWLQTSSKCPMCYFDVRRAARQSALPVLHLDHSM
mmetsp:Transcript_16000/g.43142  ORF Transcript_16000/g.43142 Transcript_16000/m.43142 type:complete len:81 (+) Transcript_16000:70-312(+)